MEEKQEIEQYSFEYLEDELLQKHKDFCREYFVNGWNRVKAYMKCYPDSSYGAAAVSANELLKNPKIVQYLNFLKEDLEKTCYVNKASMLNELLKIANSNISHLHDNWTELSFWEEILDKNPDVMSAVESIDTKTETRKIKTDGDDEFDIEVKFVKIKLYSKTTAIEMINKMLGYNMAEKRDITTNGKELQIILSKEEVKEISKALNADC